VLAVQYGMGGDALARRIGQSPAHAAHLLELHRRTYPVFWQWSDSAVAYAMLTNRLHTVFGWTLQLSEPLNVRSLQNYPMQANGAEMLRLACCLATEAGVQVCAPVHDAVLVEAPVASLAAIVATTQQAMTMASRIVLGGYTLRSSATCIASPDRFCDPRGAKMWRTVLTVLEQRQAPVPCVRA
jgi:DNA polymerase I-like protein with 3'-5' exonuclease and polymerase domains